MIMNKRGAYFFVLDAMIAGSIIILSLILIFSTHSLRPESSPTLRMVEDYASFLLTTKIREFQGAYVKSLVNDGNITDLDNTLAEQLVEFYYYNQTGQKNTTDIMKGFLQGISKGIIPDQRSFAVYINQTLLYERQKIPVGDAKLVLNSKKISFKRINETYIYGPVIFEVKIWV